MRQAAVKKLRRTLRDAVDWRVRLDRLSFAGVPGLGSADIAFFAPFSVLSGPNGVGKTTLLRALWATLDPAAANAEEGTAEKLKGGSTSTSIRIGEQSLELRSTLPLADDVTSGDHGLCIIHLDSASAVGTLKKAFPRDDTVEEITDGESSAALEGDDLEAVKYITRRDYRSVVLYEIEFTDGPLPFFEVAYGDDRYDSRTMGTGELAAFYLWWALRRTPEHAIVLIEEPETFLSPGSQEALGDIIVRETVEKKLVCVATSHSAGIISHLPKECIRFIVRERQGVRAVNDQPPAIVLRNLGITLSVEAVLFVEDEAGRAFAKGLLERFDASISRRVSIVVRNGWGDIVSVLRSLGDTNNIALKFIGLFDGDVKDQVPRDFASRSAFLPGDKALEIQFREMVTADPAALIEAAGARNLETILAALEGRDHHDWYEELCREIGLTKSQLFPILFPIWLRGEGNIDLAQATYTRLSILLGMDQRL